MKLRLGPRSACFGLAALALLGLTPASGGAEASGSLSAPSRLTGDGSRRIVSPSGPFTTIQAALVAAQEGDEIEVQPGKYAGPLVVDKSVKLQGVDRPVIDGGEQGTVVTLAAPGIEFRGFQVQGSGTEPDRDHSGITIQAPHVTVENNRLKDVLFGVFVGQANDAVVRNNDITGKAEFDIARKGDAIRLWYSARAVLEGNYIHDSRDVVMWYAKDVIIRDNGIEHGRYGIHLMYCDDARIEHNRLLDNAVGIFTMYSNGLTIQDNVIRGQRGPSGYALGFKDADNIEIANNALVDNRAGVYLDNTPFSPQGYGRFHDNILAFNDVGVILLPAVRGNGFEKNTFWENVEQVAEQGNGALGANTWQGNYWSDYSGFDADGDGQGDFPYRSERLFENLTDREPTLRALLFSPAAQAIEAAAAAFPIIRPQPKLTDPAPRMQPAVLPAFARPAARKSGDMLDAGLLLLSLGLVVGVLAWLRGGSSRKQLRKQGERMESGMDGAPRRAITLRVEQVSKQYGSAKALDGVSFEAQAGEALALWGMNGAGKSTLLKSILGLIDFRGAIQVEGRDVRQNGKAARRSIGYVPQEVVFYDWSVQATMEFYARLKKVNWARIPVLLECLGLKEHARKPVPALSGGLKQRLALAIALLADPPILLLDEPMTSLDSRARSDYLSLLASLRTEGKTIVFASHRLEEVETLGDRVLVLEGGQLLHVLSPEALRSQWVPEVNLLLRVSEHERSEAAAMLQQAGLQAHLNGRGTVAVRIRGEEKMQPLQMLNENGIQVMNFEIE